MKMTQVKLMEMELEEKLAKAQEGNEDWSANIKFIFEMYIYVD